MQLNDFHLKHLQNKKSIFGLLLAVTIKWWYLSWLIVTLSPTSYELVQNLEYIILFRLISLKYTYIDLNIITESNCYESWQMSEKISWHLTQSLNCGVLSDLQSTTILILTEVWGGQDVGNYGRCHHPHATHAVGVVWDTVAVPLPAPTSPTKSAALMQTSRGLATPQVHQGLTKLEVL